VRAELQIAKIKFESIDRILLLCNYTEQGTYLKIACSDLVAKPLLAKLNDLVLKFEHIEKITINNTVVFDIPLPKVSLPQVEDINIVATWKPSPEFFKQKFRVVNIQI
jgi:hypothetical protein